MHVAAPVPGPGGRVLLRPLRQTGGPAMITGSIPAPRSHGRLRGVGGSDPHGNTGPVSAPVPAGVTNCTGDWSCEA